MQTLILGIIFVLLQQHIQLADGVTCASNPCNLVPGQFDASNGYCCYDVPSTSTDSVCTCPNNVVPVLNAPCRTAISVNQASCNRTCLNGGVCNIVNGTQVCWCGLGYTGSSCELQGTATRCATGVCQAGACVEQTLGATVYAYCYCNPGWTGARCDQCYFTCQRVGVFPDTAYCTIGRYYYCPQASGSKYFQIELFIDDDDVFILAPIIALCPDGQKFNRLTSQCAPNATCT
ncbi:unnamed protein product [Rotaria sordida]|uniref:EGF-like domain-containing protein n=1 Tax=Rotaria sordida TaxID=392033 RepID=A0A819AEL5_9BILA|nr:unnamed protein product [Rotaria sordida]CAF3776484.1 unnamed protein product [Rotaria sordida]